MGTQVVDPDEDCLALAEHLIALYPVLELGLTDPYKLAHEIQTFLEENKK